MEGLGKRGRGYFEGDVIGHSHLGLRVRGWAREEGGTLKEM